MHTNQLQQIKEGPLQNGWNCGVRLSAGEVLRPAKSRHSRIIHTLHDAPFNGTDANREAHFGVFRIDDSPKPAACALGSLILGVAPDGC